MKYLDLDFLTLDEIKDTKKKLNIFNKIDGRANITDFAILSGGRASEYFYCGEPTLENRTYSYWAKTPDGFGDAKIILDNGDDYFCYSDCSKIGIRPVVDYSLISDYCINKKENKEGILEVEFGEYPNEACSYLENENLEILYKNKNPKLLETNKKYTLGLVENNERRKNKTIELKEYIYNNEKFVRIKANGLYRNYDQFRLSNGYYYRNDDYVWVKVSNVKWLVDEEKNKAVSKSILLSGIQFNKKCNYYGNFFDSNIKKYLVNVFTEDITKDWLNKEEEKKIENLEDALIEIERLKSKNEELKYKYIGDDRRLSEKIKDKIINNFKY